jgi:hypothetical protein
MHNEDVVIGSSGVAEEGDVVAARRPTRLEIAPDRGDLVPPAPVQLHREEAGAVPEHQPVPVRGGRRREGIATRVESLLVTSVRVHDPGVARAGKRATWIVLPNDATVGRPRRVVIAAGIGR